MFKLLDGLEMHKNISAFHILLYVCRHVWKRSILSLVCIITTKFMLLSWLVIMKDIFILRSIL